MSALLRSEVNQYNQDLSRIRHVLTETAELFEDIEAATRISGGWLVSCADHLSVCFPTVIVLSTSHYNLQ